MSRRRGWLALTAATLLLSGGVAAAAPGQVSLRGLPAFANGPQIVVAWEPAAFTPLSIGRQYRLTVQDLTVPGLSSRVVAATSTETTLTLLDGHEYAIKAVAEERECVAPGVCEAVHINGPASETRVTRVDSPVRSSRPRSTAAPSSRTIRRWSSTSRPRTPPPRAGRRVAFGPSR